MNTTKIRGLIIMGLLILTDFVMSLIKEPVLLWFGLMGWFVFTLFGYQLVSKMILIM